MFGIVTRLTSALTLGLTAYELHEVNARISEINNKLGHHEGKLQVLSKATAFNTNEIRQLKDITMHTVSVLEKFREGLLNNTEAIEICM